METFFLSMHSFSHLSHTWDFSQAKMSKSFSVFFSFNSSIILSDSNQQPPILSHGIAIFTFCTVNTRGPCCNSQPHAEKPGGRRRPFWIQNPNAQTTRLELSDENKIPCTQSVHCPPDNMAITVLVITAAATGTFKPASTVLKGQSCTMTSNGKLLGWGTWSFWEDEKSFFFFPIEMFGAVSSINEPWFSHQICRLKTKICRAICPSFSLPIREKCPLLHSPHRLDIWGFCSEGVARIFGGSCSRPRCCSGYHSRSRLRNLGMDTREEMGGLEWRKQTGRYRSHKLNEQMYSPMPIHTVKRHQVAASSCIMR